MSANNVEQRGRDSRLWQAYSSRRYTILFYALLLMLVVMPFASTFGFPQIGMRLLLAGCLLAAVMPNATRRTRTLLPVLLLLIITFQFASERGYIPVAAGLGLGVVGFTGLLAAAGALRFVIQAGRVNHETVYAALSTYLLAGLFFAQIYGSIEDISPGSMTAPEKLTEAGYVYFSFVTLASLGYGDVLPRSELARGVAVLEVIGGQLFLAVLVARLIGAFGRKDHQV